MKNVPYLELGNSFPYNKIIEMLYYQMVACHLMPFSTIIQLDYVTSLSYYVFPGCLAPLLDIQCTILPRQLATIPHWHSAYWWETLILRKNELGIIKNIFRMKGK